MTTFADLKGKKISATKGSSSERFAHELLLDATILTFQDPVSAFLALRQEKMSALVLSEIPLFRFRVMGWTTFRARSPMNSGTFAFARAKPSSSIL